MIWSNDRTRPALGLAILLFVAGAAGAQSLKYPFGATGQFTSEGMAVQTVKPGSPLDVAGVQRGDLILKIDGQFIGNQDDLVAVVNSSGGSIAMAVRKGGTGRTFRLTATLDGGGAKPGIRAPYLLGVVGKFTNDGMLIGATIPGTPAAGLGLQKGDLIGRINNQPVRTQAELYAVLNASGGTATLVVRNGQTGRVGSATVDLTTYQLGALGEFTRDGMVVATVAPDTPAARVGLQKGDLIARIDNLPVTDQRTFDAMINASGGTVLLTVVRPPNNKPARIPVNLMNNALGAWCEPDNEGMRVTAVGGGSSAALIGLERGDTILKVDDQRVRTENELVWALDNAGGFITLTVRKGVTGRVVKLEADLAR